MKSLVRGLLPMIAIIFGSITYKLFSPYSYLIPYLIFGMLLFTFLKVDVRKIKFFRTHFFMLSLQIFLALILYFFVRHQNILYAEAAFICFICPTATASTVLVRILGGKEEYSIAYVLLSHLMITILSPLFFASISSNTLPIWQQSLEIGCRVFPLVLLPIILGFISQIIYPKIDKTILVHNNIPFSLWIISLVLILADTVRYLKENSDNLITIIAMGVIGLLACIAQFYIAHYIAKKTHCEPISMRQSLGQKNTTLAIYLALRYMPHPMCSVAPSTYIIWQNIYNSYSLYRHNRKNAASEKHA